MKKLLLINLITVFAIAGSVFAKGSYHPEQEECGCPETECNTCPADKETCFDDSDLFRKDKCVAFGNAEFLFWRADAGALEYAFQFTEAVPAGTTYGIGSYKIADYDWDPGFRVALGWYNAKSFWQLYGQFTRMRIKGSDTEDRTVAVNEPLVGTFPHNAILGAELSSAASSLKLNHELGDVLVSRVFITNPHLRLRLFGGFTGGRIKQNWNVTYIDLNSQTERILNRWRFLGVGLRLGLDIDWFWGKDFYLTGKLSTAPLVGRHKNIGKITADTSGVAFEDIRYSKYRGAYNVDGYVGFSYQRSFQCTRFELFAGYELDSWFNVHEILRPSSITSQSLTTELPVDMSNGLFLMHGLTARVTVDF
ncbi:MAG: hypothetical protein KR126chlam6_00267 [Candidatus Anoxychlamydiales bacterium]|nr:hypothetical protein [Candidatus Anoxychlamydiales bacterium]